MAWYHQSVSSQINKQPMPDVVLYTDGACQGNPGPGGYAAVLKCNGQKKEVSGGFRLTTNNRMELMAAIAGLSALTEPARVTLFSDSQYLVNNYNQGFVEKWKAQGWKRDRKTPARNRDLWQELLTLFGIHSVTLRWVQGHSGQADNERCDFLAVQASQKSNLPPDVVFEQEETPLRSNIQPTLF